MGTIALVLAGAGIVCLVMCVRDLAALAFAAAAGFWLLPMIQGNRDAPVGFVAQENPQPAPPAEFRTAAGKRMRLADFRGRVVLLNLWATSCGPCGPGMSSFDRLQAMYQGDGLAVVSVTLDDVAGVDVRRYFDRNGIRNLKPYIDAAGATGIAFNARRMPTTLLIDRDGKVVGSLVGVIEWDAPDALALIRRYLDS